MIREVDKVVKKDYTEYHYVDESESFQRVRVRRVRHLKNGEAQFFFAVFGIIAAITAIASFLRKNDILEFVALGASFYVLGLLFLRSSSKLAKLIISIVFLSSIISLIVNPSVTPWKKKEWVSTKALSFSSEIKGSIVSFGSFFNTQDGWELARDKKLIREKGSSLYKGKQLKAIGSKGIILDNTHVKIHKGILRAGSTNFYEIESTYNAFPNELQGYWKGNKKSETYELKIFKEDNAWIIKFNKYYGKHLSENDKIDLKIKDVKINYAKGVYSFQRIYDEKYNQLFLSVSKKGLILHGEHEDILLKKMRLNKRKGKVSVKTTSTEDKEIISIKVGG